MKVQSIIFCLVLLSACQARKEASEDVWLEEITLTDAECQASAGIHAFAFDLFRMEVQNHPQDNNLISPFSLSSALSMLMNGARGECLEEMQRAMGMKDIPMAKLNGYFRKMTKGLARLDSTATWSTANALWVNQAVPIQRKYTDTLNRAYEAEIHSLDLVSPEAVSTINNWCKEKTKGKIDRLIAGQFSPQTALALTNAVYFNASWAIPFECSETKNELFYSPGQSPQKTMMMHRMGNCAYLKTETFEMVELPYGNGNFSMMFLLPPVGKPWHDCLKEITPAHYSFWCDSLQHNSCMVDLKIPRFSLKREMDCNALLQQQGIQKMFDADNADFTAISKWHLNVDKVIQSSFIDIHEEGTEAASATAITVTFEAEIIPMPPFISFHANRPFLFLMKERNTQTVLFIGRVINM